MSKELIAERKARRAAYQKQYRQDNKIEIAAYQRQYRQNHKSELAILKKRYRLSHGTEIKHDHLLRKFGISLEQYNELFTAQEGKCAICGKHRTKSLRTLAVDHNHVTDEIRGLLCNKCNLALGLIEDNEEILRSAIKYLQIFRNVPAAK